MHYMVIKINNIIKEDLNHYLTARIDIKNSGKFNNQIEFIYISDSNSSLTFPNWFKHKDGIGAVIESSEGKLDLKIKCIHEGNLILRLRGIYARDSKNNVVPIFIEFNQVKINGFDLIKENKLVSHDNFYDCHFNVKNEDILFVHIEWSPFRAKK